GLGGRRGGGGEGGGGFGGGGGLGEGLGPHVHAGLVTAALQEIERQPGELFPNRHGRRHGDGGGGGGGTRAEQVREATAERGFPVHLRVRSSACAAGAALTGADIVPTCTGLAAVAAGVCAGAECTVEAVRSVAV